MWPRKWEERTELRNVVGFWNCTKDPLEVSDHVFKVQLVIKCFSQAKVTCTGVGVVEGEKSRRFEVI